MNDILIALNLNLQYAKSASESTESTFQGFTAANAVWINKPQVVNRRLCGSKLTHKVVPCGVEHDTLLQQIKNSILQSENNLTCIHHVTVDDLLLETDVVFIRELLPKRLDKYQITKEIVVWSKCNALQYRVNVSRLYNIIIFAYVVVEECIAIGNWETDMDFMMPFLVCGFVALSQRQLIEFLSQDMVQPSLNC